MQNEQTLNPQSPKPSLSKDVRNSSRVLSFGTVEDFELSSDESLIIVPSQNTPPEPVLPMSRKRSNALAEPLSLQIDAFHEQEFYHIRKISVSSRSTRLSTQSDFDSACIPSLLFNTRESGEFDFFHQPDNKFSNMMNSIEDNIFEVVHSDWEEDYPGLELSDFGEEEQDSDSIYFLGDTITENYNGSKQKSDDIDGLLFWEHNALPLRKEHHGPNNSPKMVKSNQHYERESEKLSSSPDYAEPISYVPLHENNRSVEEKLSEVSTPERYRGVNSETKNNWIPFRQHNILKTNFENYKSTKINSERKLSSYLKKAITMSRRAQSKSFRKSHVGLKLQKNSSVTTPSNPRFFSTCSPEDKRTDNCTIM